MPIITAVDYGESVAIASAKVGITELTLRVTPLKVRTIRKDISDAIVQIALAQSDFVVLEAMPSNPSEIGRESFTALHERLKHISLNVVPAFEIALVRPAQWKPFMQTRRQAVKTNWDAITRHDVDAICILEYWIRLKFGFNKEVLHV